MKRFSTEKLRRKVAVGYCSSAVIVQQIQSTGISEKMEEKDRRVQTDGWMDRAAASKPDGWTASCLLCKNNTDRKEWQESMAASTWLLAVTNYSILDS